EGAVGAYQHLASGAGAAHAGDQLLHEAQRAPPRPGLPLAQPRVQDLARARAGGEQGVIAAFAGVAETGALLRVAVHLTDEAVDVDHQALLIRAGARRPGARKRLGQHAVELAHVPQGDRTQTGAGRRRPQGPRAGQRRRAPGPEQVAVVDRVGPERDRVRERADLAARPRSPGPPTKVDRLIDEPLEAKPVD